MQKYCELRQGSKFEVNDSLKKLMSIFWFISNFSLDVGFESLKILVWVQKYHIESSLETVEYKRKAKVRFSAVGPSNDFNDVWTADECVF